MADENQTPEEEQQAEDTPEAVSEEAVEETPAEPEAEETPEAVSEEAVEETPAEPEAEEPAAEEEPAEEPSAEAEEPAAEAEEPAAEAEEPAPAAEAAEQPPADAEESAPAPQSVKKPKRKRLPRSERHKHSKPKRERPAERRPIVRLPKPEHARGRSQERRGLVISSGMDKTIVVKVDTVKAHPRYKKVVRRSSKFHAHDEQNAAKVGDVVRIVETRPLSKTKNWRLAEVLEEAK
jgi:small subunit ribosomal protein S17